MLLSKSFRRFIVKWRNIRPLSTDIHSHIPFFIIPFYFIYLPTYLYIYLFIYLFFSFLFFFFFTGVVHIKLSDTSTSLAICSYLNLLSYYSITPLKQESITVSSLVQVTSQSLTKPLEPFCVMRGGGHSPIHMSSSSNVTEFHNMSDTAALGSFGTYCSTRSKHRPITHKTLTLLLAE